MSLATQTRKLLGWALPLALAGAAALAVGAQTSRSVRGIVCDQDGTPLKGAVVQIENTRTLLIRSYVSQDDGAYQFHGLDPNADYKLRATYHRVSSPVKTLSMFDDRPVAFINIRIELK